MEDHRNDGFNWSLGSGEGVSEDRGVDVSLTLSQFIKSICQNDDGKCFVEELCSLSRKRLACKYSELSASGTRLNLHLFPVHLSMSRNTNSTRTPTIFCEPRRLILG